MRLFYCPKCGDVVKLEPWRKCCQCGQACGQLRSDGDIEINTEAIPIGISDWDLSEVNPNIETRHKDDLPIMAWIYGSDNPYIHVKDQQFEHDVIFPFWRTHKKISNDSQD